MSSKGSTWLVHRAGWVVVALAACPLLLVACRTCRGPADRRHEAQLPCPAQLPAPAALPGEQPEHLIADYWLQSASDPNAVLLEREAIAAHNARVLALRDASHPDGRWDPVARPIDRAEIAAQIEARLNYLQTKVLEGKLVDSSGQRPDRLAARLRAHVRRRQPTDEVRLVRRDTPLRCYPSAEALYESLELQAFDYSQCSQLRFAEPVRVLSRLDQLWHVWSSYASGWVTPAALGPPLTADQVERYLAAKTFVTLTRDHIALWSAARGGSIVGVAHLGSTLALPRARTEPTATADRDDLDFGHDAPLRVLAPSHEGVASAWIRRPADVLTLGYAPFTREAVLRRAFTLLDSPYGWGGMGSKRDCSRMLMDLFASFGILLPRNSSRQADAAEHFVDVSELDETAKTETIERANRDSIVLLYFRGHIMLYLGRREGQLYALHQFSGYLVPCRGGGETMYRVNRTAVTNLELGKGSSRGSFIRRVTRLVVF